MDALDANIVAILRIMLCGQKLLYLSGKGILLLTGNRVVCWTLGISPMEKYHILLHDFILLIILNQFIFV
jgi:hypothetical protein